MRRRTSLFQRIAFVRLVSVLMGFMLWAIVNSNATDSSLAGGLPTTTSVLRGVPVEVITSPRLVAVNVTPARMDVNLAGSELDVAKAQMESSGVRVLATAENLGPGLHDAPVTVAATPTSAVTYIPTTAFVTLDLQEKVSVSLRPQARILGKPANGFQTGTPVLRVHKVTVSGPDTSIHQVFAVIASTDVRGDASSVTKSVPLVALERDGAPVAGVVCDPSSISVTVPVHSVKKTVPVSVTTVGTPASHFAVGGVVVSPSVITVSGATSLLDSLKNIVVPPLDVAGWNRTQTVTVTVPSPFVGGSVSAPALHATVEIVPSKTVTFTGISVRMLGERKGMSYIVPGLRTVNVTVMGPANIVAEMSRQDIDAFVDVSGIGDNQLGILPIQLSLPTYVATVGVKPGTVTVMAKNAQS